LNKIVNLDREELKNFFSRAFIFEKMFRITETLLVLASVKRENRSRVRVFIGIDEA